MIAIIKVKTAIKYVIFNSEKLLKHESKWIWGNYYYLLVINI